MPNALWVGRWAGWQVDGGGHAGRQACRWRFKVNHQFYHVDWFLAALYNWVATKVVYKIS